MVSFFFRLLDHTKGNLNFYLFRPETNDYVLTFQSTDYKKENWKMPITISQLQIVRFDQQLKAQKTLMFQWVQQSKAEDFLF